MRQAISRKRPGLTTSKLIENLSARYTCLSSADVRLAVELILSAMSAQVSSKRGRVEIRGFGSWASRYRMPRNSRNPKTGASVEVPGKFVPRFKPSVALRSLVNKYGK